MTTSMARQGNEVRGDDNQARRSRRSQQQGREPLEDGTPERGEGGDARRGCGTRARGAAGLALSCGQDGDPDEGSGTVAVIGVLLVAVGLITGASGVVAARVAALEAQTAAELGALAAADAQRGLAGGEPCAVARRVVEANGARLAGCAETGEDMAVTAEAGGEGLAWPAQHRAQAGPPQR
ncbi:Rv3654c family TadE-like protein [Falsarthrobacter nasiphocae]|uniref:Secretion/DNA translocation related TadE-like protein n=1 Tax=Falsarthrobacter nasiphocae TaxID=189863 RepID=A0AAE4C6N8_9MICC|nr:Rv3654c family TadE-like protein [Falsarthrobacter nasiphocae]MDR6892357.1 secretion/DNA translocation related TadE-like protein [Falsarthrobacter nasiphocae]